MSASRGSIHAWTALALLAALVLPLAAPCPCPARAAASPDCCGTGEARLSAMDCCTPRVERASTAAPVAPVIWGMSVSPLASVPPRLALATPSAPVPVGPALAPPPLVLRI